MPQQAVMNDPRAHEDNPSLEDTGMFEQVDDKWKVQQDESQGQDEDQQPTGSSYSCNNNNDVGTCSPPSMQTTLLEERLEQPQTSQACFDDSNMIAISAKDNQGEDMPWPLVVSEDSQKPDDIHVVTPDAAAAHLQDLERGSNSGASSSTGTNVMTDIVQMEEEYHQTKVPAVGGRTARLFRHAKKNQEDSEGELPPHEDPFAPRTGKTLSWRNVNMTLAAKGSVPEKKLLDNVWGEVPKKEITAIMGPSGAGKTSLLNILAGRAASRGPLKIDADVRLDDYAVNPRHIKVRKLIAFVAQDESLQMTATPREAIAFSARLRLPRSVPDCDIQKLTKRMLTELGLNDCADTIIGGALVKGLSGGERKRTSVGVELVVKPAVVFLDEPTSGLDSFSAVQLCDVLKKVANAGASVLFTIHQPASEIFSSFDHLILLNKGRVMYQGPTTLVPAYFSQRGHACPPNYNPADWIMNRAQAVPIKELDEAGFFPTDERKLSDPVPLNTSRQWSRYGRDLGVMPDDNPVGKIRQIKMLLRREVTNLMRDKVALAGRIGFSTLLSVLVGAIFIDAGSSDTGNIANLQSHFGALIMSCCLCMFGTAQPALLAFPSERPVFVREYSTNHYSVISYFCSRFAVEALVTAIQVFKISLITYYMIGFQLNFGMYYITMYGLAMSSTALAVSFGCAIEDPKLGQEMFPLLFVPQFLLSGFFVIPSLIPAWIRWARYLCSLTFGLLIVMVEEFDDCGSKAGQANCKYLLDSLEANANDAWHSWIGLLVLFVVFRLLALFLLRKKATKFF